MYGMSTTCMQCLQMPEEGARSPGPSIIPGHQHVCVLGTEQGQSHLSSHDVFTLLKRLVRPFPVACHMLCPHL